jgi:hypothetical protein
LSIRVRADEIDTINPGVNHVRDGIAAAAADANDFYDGILVMCIH